LALTGVTRTKAKRYRESRLLAWARLRAKRKRLPFNLTLDDIQIPPRCPALGIPLIPGSGSSQSPTLDRIIPSLGYTKGNVVVISALANAIKNSGTPLEILKVAKFYLKLLKD
jgi:hypothetical protein